jgi:hypothetical protein
MGVKGNLPDETGLLKVKLELLCWVQVVQDNESAGGFIAGDVTEADALS